MIASMQHTELSGLAGIASSPPQAFKQGEFYAIAATGDCGQACDLAKSHALDEGLLDALAHRAEPEVAYALAHNPHARLGRKVLRRLMERGRERRCPGSRPAQPRRSPLCHLRLFLQADAEERGHLIAVARAIPVLPPSVAGSPIPSRRRQARQNSKIARSTSTPRRSDKRLRRFCPATCPWPAELPMTRAAEHWRWLWSPSACTAKTPRVSFWRPIRRSLLRGTSFAPSCASSKACPGAPRRAWSV